MGPKGQRLRVGVPHGHWKTTTFVAGLRLSGMVAPMVLDGPINGAAFQAYVDQVLVPELKRGDTVIMDNLGSHKGAPFAALSKRPAKAPDPIDHRARRNAKSCRRLMPREPAWPGSSASKKNRRRQRTRSA
jgi:hypothetical protein